MAEVDLEQLQPQAKKPKVTKREFQASDDLKVLASIIIRNKRLDVHPAKIDYLLVEPNISKTVPAKIIKSSREILYYSGFNYVIQVSKDLWDALDMDTRKLLLEHQLRRIVVIQNDKTGDWAFKLRIPDIGGFEKIIKENGFDWLKKIRYTISSLYDLTPAEEDSIKV